MLSGRRAGDQYQSRGGRHWRGVCALQSGEKERRTHQIQLHGHQRRRQRLWTRTAACSRSVDQLSLTVELFLSICLSVCLMTLLQRNSSLVLCPAVLQTDLRSLSKDLNAQEHGFAPLRRWYISFYYQRRRGRLPWQLSLSLNLWNSGLKPLFGRNLRVKLKLTEFYRKFEASLQKL